MQKFIEFDCTIINLEEIMYICAEYDKDYDIREYHIVMKDQHHFTLPIKDGTEEILFLIKQQLDVISSNDYLN